MKLKKMLDTLLGATSHLISGKPQSYEIWTDASFSENHNRIGCAAYIEEKEGKESPYVLVFSRPKTFDSNTDTAELQAITGALQHVGSKADVILHTDSDGAMKRVSGLREGSLSGEDIGRSFSEEVSIVQRHEKLQIGSIFRSKTKHPIEHPIRIADEFASYARRKTGDDLIKHLNRLGRQLSVRYVLK